MLLLVIKGLFYVRARAQRARGLERSEWASGASALLYKLPTVYLRAREGAPSGGTRVWAMYIPRNTRLRATTKQTLNLRSFIIIFQ